MIVRADDLRAEGIDVDLRLDPGPLSHEGELPIELGGARLTARVRPSREGLHCVGRMVASVRIACSRCLDPYALDVDREFSLDFLPSPRAGEGGDGEVHIGREDLDVGYLEAGGRLDMGALATEQIYLEIPMKPLCAPDCRGLCPRCGANLNVQPCGCAGGGRTDGEPGRG